MPTATISIHNGTGSSILTRAVWQGKEIKDIQMGKEGVGPDDMILYM